MSGKKFFSSIVLIITLLSMNFSSFAAVQVRAADTSQTEVSQEISVYRVYYKSAEEIQQLMAFDLFEFNNLEEQYVLVALAADEVIKVEGMGFKVAIDKEETANFSLLSMASQNQINTIPGYSCYRTVEETYATAANLAATYPNLATWTDVGNSWEKSVGQSDGYDLFVLKLTNSSITGDKPKMFITASIHAREYTAAELATRYAEYLVSNYNVDADITWLLDYHEIHLMLQMNPDGRKEAESGRSWRKNTNENYCGVTSTNRGADLNRNYAFYWNYCSGCSSGSPCDATYRGPSAASEPEVSAVQAYMRSIFPDQREAALSAPAPSSATGIFIDLHSYSQLVLWPWGMTTGTAPNGSALQTLGRKFAYFNNYTPQKSSQLYTTDGDSVDFAYGELGIAAYTFELGTKFFESCTNFQNTILPNNLPALLYAGKIARTPYMTPLGPDTISLAVSSATVPAGTLVTLTGVANDTRYKSGSGEATQAIAQAEYYLDTPPWVAGATAIPMSASDGTFNSTSENLTASVNTTGWSNGRHILYSRSKDANNNWGVVSAIFLTVEGAANVAPVVNDIPGQTILEGASFVSINLDEYVSDSDNNDADMLWSFSGNSALGVIVTDRIATITIPNLDWNGSESITFRATDPGGLWAEDAATFTVTAVNDPPVANPQSVTVGEDTPTAITLTGTDVDGDALAYTVVSSPLHGSLSGTAPNLTYSPSSNYTGIDSFTFKVSDGTSDSGTASVSITVTAVNDAPVANPQSVTLLEDGNISLLLSGSDIDEDALTFSIQTPPAHGSLSGTGANKVYTPFANFNGTDSFTFVVNDGKVNSAPATVSITISPVNDAPVALAQIVGTNQDTPLSIVLSGSDIDGDALTFIVATQPAHGTLSGTAPNKIYTPALGYVGSDSFTFTASDGSIASSPATISISVSNINDAPLANAQSVSTDEDTALAITLSGTDADGDSLTYRIITQPTHGTLTGTAPSLSYVPSANYFGSDSFTFVANDGTVDSASATVAITIAPVNDAPVANPQQLVTTENTALPITLTGSDIEGSSLTFSVTSGPSHGMLSGTGESLLYTPTSGYVGDDSFNFFVNDGSIDSALATIEITVTRTNVPPVASGQDLATSEDTSLGVTLSGTDTDNDPLTYSVSAGPTHGIITGTAPNLTYTPNANYNGEDSFTFVANDGQSNSAPATVSITVNPVNDAPIALPQTLSVDEDSTLNVVLTGSDVDGDGLTFAVVNGPSHGTLSGTIPNLVYTPVENYNGADTITFTASDGILVSSSAVISLTVRPVNDLPVAESQAVVTNENTPVNVTLVGTDIDGDALTYMIDIAPLHGEITGTLPNLVYTPDDYYAGPDVFSFYVNDGRGNSNSADVTVLIIDFNYLPLVFNQTLSINENSPLSITLTGMDPDGDTLGFFIKTPPAHGTLSGTAPNLVYTPNPGYTGSDSFTFAASDQEGESNEGVISIQITTAGPSELFFDDFETDLGWVRNAFGTDTATMGYFERANPESVAYNGDKQLGTTVSGSYDLVTGPLAGSSAGDYDLDGGKTSMLSPTIVLPVGRELTLSFSYYVSHYTNSSTADYLRVFVIGDNTVKVFEELGANDDDDAVWDAFSADISSFAGQSIQVLIEAADASTASYFEAAVDDVGIFASTPNNPPVALSASYEMTEDGSLPLVLTGSDPEGNTITFQVRTTPSHGTLVGTTPNVTYMPAANYFGSDSFAFITNDGKLNSEPATISINISPINDAPMAVGQTLSITKDVPLSITITGTDIEGDSLTYTVSTPPTHGVLTGTAPNLVYTPASGYTGSDSFQFIANDGNAVSLPATVSLTVNPAGPTTIFWDDFETNKGWVRNPLGTDTATSGYWERADPETVSYYGYKQLGTSVSGTHNLVTGPLAGSSSGSYDLDGGLTSIRSPQIILPTGRNLTLSFSYYLAHYSNSSTADYLRIKIVGSTTTTLFQELGANNNDDASWSSFTISLNNYAGQTVYLLIQAADASTASLVEAAIDDVLIIAK